MKKPIYDYILCPECKNKLAKDERINDRLDEWAVYYCLKCGSLVEQDFEGRITYETCKLYDTIKTKHPELLSNLKVNENHSTGELK